MPSARPWIVFLTTASLLFLTIGCESPSDELTIYSGRSQSLVDPVVERFEAETGIDVQVRYGETAQMAMALTEEGDRSDADLFWAQDAGALGALHESNLFATLPDSVLEPVTGAYRSPTDAWVATSGRARALVYAPDRVDEDELPTSIFDLADERYADRVGWAPVNGSFQSHVTALREIEGDERTRNWLQAMDDNGAVAYSRNSTIVQGVADGEADFGLANHYYVLRFKDRDPNFPVEQTFFAPSDPGNLVNVAGVGMLDHTERSDEALQFIAYLLSEEGQQYFVDEVFEYPVTDGIEPSMDLPAMGDLEEVQTDIDLESLRDLQATLDMMRDVGLL